MVFITAPNAERTFAVYLGAALELGPDDLKKEYFEGYDYFHIEGYLVQNQNLIRKAVEMAKEAGCIISMDMASYNVVESNEAFLHDIVDKYVDIVFANESEAKSFTRMEPRDALDELARHCDIAVVKIGKQYWMQEDLRTQYYRDGTALTQQTKLGEGAGYFCPEESDAYQYNGEAVLAGELTPSGWKIPIMEDWETLNEYIGGEASLLKVGTWASTSKEPTEVAPATNLTGLSIYPQGMWGNEANAYYGQAVGYWCMEPSGEAIPENIIVFKFMATFFCF